jgi:DNA-binding Xre family transcriptional regulator
MSTKRTLHAETFAREILALLAQGDITLADVAHSIDVTPAWLERVVAGEIIELQLLTVLGICRKLRLMPDDIWDAATVAEAFADFPGAAFLDGDD